MDLQEKLVQYLDRELNEDDIKEIKDLLAENPELRKEKELYEQIMLSIRKYGEKQLRTELDGYLEDHLNQNKGGKVRFMKSYVFYGSIAASLTILLIFYNQFNTPKSQQIPMELQLEQMPVHADSAIYKAEKDTILLDSVKNIETKVDK